MADLVETTQWEAGVFQIETDTPALGGPGGPANTQAQQLANRTAWLKEQVLAGLASISTATRDVVMKDDAGNLQHTVWIPKFRVVAGTFDGWPAADLNMGGFFIDKYTCSHVDATAIARGIGFNPTIAPDDGNIACSRPGVVPWTALLVGAADAACTNRKFGGVSAHLVKPAEWAAVALLAMANPALRGNTLGGRSAADPDVWESYGAPDPTAATGRTLVGTGPKSWSHNGRPDGVVDYLGNVAEMLGMLGVVWRYTHSLASTLSDADGISDVDESIVVASVEEPGLWPAAAGICYIAAEGVNSAEYVQYSSFVDNLDATYTLTGVSRGQKGSSPAAHGDGAAISLQTSFCLLPGGAVGQSVIELTDIDEQTSIFLADIVYGPTCAGIVEGATLRLDDEECTVVQVLFAPGATAGTLSVYRGANGTAVVAHPANTGCVMFGLELEDAGGDIYMGVISALRTEPMLAPMAWPAATVPVGTDSVWKDCLKAHRGSRVQALVRGGHAISGDSVKTGFEYWLHDATTPTSRIGFRAAFSLE